MAEELRTSEEICEALVRHTEVSGSDVLEKKFFKDGRIICSLWCIIGVDAEGFAKQARKWLEENGFKED